MVTGASQEHNARRRLQSTRVDVLSTERHNRLCELSATSEQIALAVCWSRDNARQGDRLYPRLDHFGNEFHRTGTSSGGGKYPAVETPASSNSGTTLDGEVGDMDGDGDYDILVSNDNGSRNMYYENTTRNNGSGPTDTTAPYIPNVEQAPDRASGSEPTVVRAQVYDNAPYYITWYNETWLEVKENGGPAQIVPMVTSGGQIFRGEIPGNLSGNVTYQVFSEDEYGNQGSSAILSFTATGGGAPGTALCFGDSGCQCGNTTPLGSGEGCENSQGHGAILATAGSASIANDDLVFQVSQARPGQPTLFVQGQNLIAVPFKDGKLCTGNPTERMGVAFLNASGQADSSGFSVVTEGNITSPGSVRYYQAWYRDPAISVCGEGSNFTSGIQITWQP